MGQRASHEDDVFHIGEAEICYELATAAKQAVVFLADKTRSNALFLHSELVHGARQIWPSQASSDANKVTLSVKAVPGKREGV